MSVFRELHRPGDPLVLANAWDAGSAKMLQNLGAKAIATSSASQAFGLGLRDTGQISRDAALAHAEELRAAVTIPVSGDFEDGFGESPEACAETTRLSAEIGLAGLCIEGLNAGEEVYPFDLSVERVAAAASAAKAAKIDIFFVARADGVMAGQYDMDEALRRIKAFDAAGADGLYVPLPPTVEDLSRIINATQKPVNVLATGVCAALSFAQFAQMGVARISFGSTLARVGQRAVFDCARAVFRNGDFSGLADGLPAAETDKFLT